MKSAVLKQKKKFVAVLGWFLLSIHVYAMQNVISRICFEGLQRTDETYMQSLLSRYIGSVCSDAVLKKIKTVLQKEELFSDISLSVTAADNDHFVLSITVKEKISRFIVPYGGITESSFFGGFFFMDTNMAGKNDLFWSGGYGGPEIISGQAGCMVHPQNLRRPGLETSLSINHGTCSIADSRGRTQKQYFNTDVSFKAAALYKAGDSVSGSFGILYICRKIQTDCKNNSSFQRIGIIGRLSIACNDWNDWFLSGICFALEGASYIDTDSVCSQTVKSSFDYQQPVVPRLRLLFHTAGVLGNNLTEDSWFRKEAVGSELFPTDFASNAMATVFTGMECAVFRCEMALFTVSSACEYTLAKQYNRSIVESYGPKAVICAYLKQISLPALTCSFGYNIPYNMMQWSVSLGLNY